MSGTGEITDQYRQQCREVGIDPDTTTTTIKTTYCDGRALIKPCCWVCEHYKRAIDWFDCEFHLNEETLDVHFDDKSDCPSFNLKKELSG